MELIQMNLIAGILIIGIILFRQVFVNRIPKRVMMILWGIVVLRLLFPSSIPLPLQEVGGLMSRAQAVYVTAAIDAADMAEAEQQPGTDTVVFVVEEAAKEGWGKALTVVYLLGTAAMILGSVYLYVRDGRFFRESLPMGEKERQYLVGRLVPEEKEQKYLKKVGFRISDRTATPVTYGVFQPAIVFPKGIFLKEEKELRFCLLHELVHIKNHDNLRKLVVHAALCIHWFNPLVWVMYFLVNRDMELLCDEKAVRKCRANRQDYALALLSLAERRTMGFRTALGFGKNAVKERILAVMSAGKPTAGSILAAVLAIGLALTLFLSSQMVIAFASTETAAEYTVTMGSTTDIGYYDGNEQTYAYGEGEPQKQIGVAIFSDDILAYDAMGSAETTVDADTAEADAATVWEIADETSLPDELVISLRELGKEFEGEGLQVQIMPDDYQLYFNENPVYFFADNRNQDGDGFSGRVFAKEAGGENGDTGVATVRDENGMIVGLVNLSVDESEKLARAWTR